MRSLCGGSCGADREPILEKTCLDGTWRCPDGLIALNECPLDSCARSVVSCCNDVTGTTQRAVCGSNEKYEPCPKGTRELGPEDYDCIPAETGVTDCSELAGSCRSDELRCSSGGGLECGLLCACKLDASNSLIWACEYRTCP